MQAPYIVGRWVKGAEHYGRQGLVDYLLSAQDSAYWLVGTRRMGKTSLLRQIELTALRARHNWVPLFLDLQGCATPDELTQELLFALEDCADRLSLSDRILSDFADQDAVQVLRKLARQLAAEERDLLLLIDEAEGLLNFAAEHEAWLSRLRKVLLEGRQRTIVASTKALVELSNSALEWVTSPFLFGFHLKQIWPLGEEGARALVRQTQADRSIQADAQLIDEILHYTNRHPHLIQYLCQRLFVPQNGRIGYLRPIEEADLAIDHLLDAYFHFDFHQLSSLEQDVLLVVSQASTVTTNQLLELYNREPTTRTERLLSLLAESGLLRVHDNSWSIGNEFLRRWLNSNRDHLQPSDPAISGGAALSLEDPKDNHTLRSMEIDRIYPAEMQPPRRLGETEFFATVRRFFQEIRHLVEQDDGHKLLINRIGDEPILRSEEEVQIALKHWLRPMCRVHDIDVNREPLTGRGFLDFKFSIGQHQRCLVEVKLYNSAKLQHGASIQLPLYLVSDRARYGIYVPVFLESDGYEKALNELKRVAIERSRTHDLIIEIIDIRAWKPTSASKASAIEASDRYPRLE